MKLKDFFEENKDKKIGVNQKIFIYDDFLTKSDKKPLLQRFSFYSKVASYSFVFFLIAFSFYFSFVDNNQSLKNNDTKVVDSGSGFFIKENNTNTSNVVKANSIGNIIEANGDFKILKDGKEYNTNKLYDGNTILLMNNSKLKFNVNSGVTAYVKGPAELNIKYLGKDDGVKDFLLNLVDGKYIEVNSEKEKDNSNDNIIVKTKDFEVEPKNINQNMDFKISSKDDSKILENKGGDVVVKKVVNDQKIYSEVKSNQTVKIKDKIQEIKEVKKISEKVKNKEVENKYSINNSDSKSNKTGDNENISSLSKFSTKDVLTDKDFNKLKNLLYPSFVKNDVESLVKTYFRGDKDGIQIVYKNFLTRVLNIYKVLDLKIDSEILKSKKGSKNISINDIYIALDQLLAKSNKKYYLPDKYTKVLKRMLSWVVIIQNNDFGKFKEQEEIEISDIINKLDLDKYKKDLLMK